MVGNSVYPGARIGSLTVIKRAGHTRSGLCLWECRCDCGNKVKLRYSALYQNKHSSCGCYTASLEPGAVYGIYTVVDAIPIYLDGKSNAYYRLICKCGNTRMLTKPGFMYTTPKRCTCNTLMDKIHVGDKFGVYTVIAAPIIKPRDEYILCRCKCGVEKRVRINDLFYGEVNICKCKLTDDPNYYKLYNIWFTIKAKCNNVNHPRYNAYGGRGIRVSPEFEEFASFYAIMGSSYCKGMRIKRIDIKGDYSPDNVRWTRHNPVNLGRADYISVTDPNSGEILTARALAAKYNMNPKVLMYRINMGVTGKDLIAPN